MSVYPTVPGPDASDEEYNTFVKECHRLNLCPYGGGNMTALEDKGGWPTPMCQCCNLSTVCGMCDCFGRPGQFRL